MTFYLHRVLPEDAPAWIALGWFEVARSHVTSLMRDQVVIRWNGTDPPHP